MVVRAARRGATLRVVAMDLHILAIVPILSVLLIAHELGHFFTARRAGITVEEFGVGLPPRLVGIRRGGILYSLNAIPFGAFVRMLGEEDPTAPGSFARKPKWVRAVVLAAGSAMNFLVAWLMFALVFATGIPQVTQVTSVRVTSVSPDSPAAAAGLQPGDVVRSINGRPAVPLEEFQRITRENLGKPITLEVERDGTARTVSITPREHPPQGEGPLGVAIQGDGPHEIVRLGILQSIVNGLLDTLAVVIGTLAIPFLLLRGLIPLEAARPVGLPGMAQFASDAAAVSVQTGWLFPLLRLTGFISAGLAVANMLPIPALDGGRLLFVIIEAIRGSRISPEREAAVHFVGLVALLALMILISLNDLSSPLPKIDWGVR
jgi:regulator of sigma E protease